MWFPNSVPIPTQCTKNIYLLQKIITKIWTQYGCERLIQNQQQRLSTSKKYKKGLNEMSTYHPWRSIILNYAEVIIKCNSALIQNLKLVIHLQNADHNTCGKGLWPIKTEFQIRGATCITVIHSVEPPRRGVCPFLYLHRVPRDMRGVSPPVSLLQFHARTPAQWNSCKYYYYGDIYARVVIFKRSTCSVSVMNINSSEIYRVLSENLREKCLSCSASIQVWGNATVLKVPISGSVSARNFSFS